MDQRDDGKKQKKFNKGKPPHKKHGPNNGAPKKFHQKPRQEGRQEGQGDSFKDSDPRVFRNNKQDKDRKDKRHRTDPREARGDDPSKSKNSKPLGKAPPKDIPFVPGPPKRYGVLFFETFQAAKTQKELLIETAESVDQLNVVIKAEGNMDDPELLGLVTKAPIKIFAGNAWYIIHERRKSDGWYDSLQP